MKVLLLALSSVIGFTLAARRWDSCDDLPRQHQEVCKRMKMHGQHLEEKLAVGLVDFCPNSTANQLDPANITHVDCRTLSCFAKLAQEPVDQSTSEGFVVVSKPTTSPFRKALRKEYRTLTKAEREAYHNALKTMKQQGTFDDLAWYHVDITAHGGPAFLPWHREYLKRYELELRRIDPNVALPYWDSSLDNGLEDPLDSTMFTATFVGASDSTGTVIDGPFSTWKGKNSTKVIRRNVGGSGLYSLARINIMLGYTDIKDILAYNNPDRYQAGCQASYDPLSPESQHDNVHVYVGGDVNNLDTASFDPIFYMHHAFVDCLWEEWRQKQQKNKTARGLDYPPDDESCTAPTHFSYSAMSNFPGVVNSDGVSNIYTDEFYEYAPRPTCSSTNEDCGSPFLFCDKTFNPPQCTVKMQDGADCSVYPKTVDACLGGCYNRKCVSDFVFWCSSKVCATITNSRQKKSCLQMCNVDEMDCENVAAHTCSLNYKPYTSANECLDRRTVDCAAAVPTDL